MSGGAAAAAVNAPTPAASATASVPKRNLLMASPSLSAGSGDRGGGRGFPPRRDHQSSRGAGPVPPPMRSRLPNGTLGPMRQTVLIVDDHPAFRSLARALMELEGYAVVGEAEDGETALAAVEELRPDVVLLD